MNTAAILARLTERQAELERLGDIGTARAEALLGLHADVLALAALIEQQEKAVTMIADMLQTAGSA